MRIIGGKWRGHVLHTPKGYSTRPTGARLREALFSILASHEAGMENTRVLDLFAGSGALGFEALSRGAAFCCFMDNAASALAVLHDNAETLGAGAACAIKRYDATKLGACEGAGFDLVFADAPYGKGLAAKAVQAVHKGGWLAAGARIIVEEDRRNEFVAAEGFTQTDRRAYGDTEFIFLQVAG